MRVGELTISEHIIKAANVYLGRNKDKLLIILYSSKTHGISDRPQKIKIEANKSERSGSYLNRHFCPFHLISEYLQLRGDYVDEAEPLFVFRDRNPVTADNARKILKESLGSLGLSAEAYDMHSLCIGRTSDLIKFKYTIDEVKDMGRWKSNVIYKYIRKLV